MMPQLYIGGNDIACAREGAFMERESSEVILVVDDDPIVRRLVARVLTDQGFRVVEAHCGESGLKVFRETLSPIRLVVSDVLMPNMTGPEMVRQILKTDPTVRVIFMSGTPSNSNLPDGYRRRFVFLHKPFSSQILRDCVRECLESCV